MTKPDHNRADVTPDSEGGTRHIYNEAYFQGGREKSNYDNYVEQSRGPTTMLAETLYRFFRPVSSLDVGCAVGHAVKRLRELGTEAYGYDISDWAVKHAGVPFVRSLDISREHLTRQYDLIYSYDVVEHLPPERLEFAVKEMWAACRKDMLIVPATYENGETSDLNEPTHIIFQSRAWWRDFFTHQTGARYDHEATMRFENEEHSRIFNYSGRILIFTRLRAPETSIAI